MSEKKPLKFDDRPDTICRGRSMSNGHLAKTPGKMRMNNIKTLCDHPSRVVSNMNNTKKVLWDDTLETEVSTDDYINNVRKMGSNHVPSRRVHRSIPVKDVYNLPAKLKYKITKSTIHNGIDCCKEHAAARRDTY